MNDSIIIKFDGDVFNVELNGKPCVKYNTGNEYFNCLEDAFEFANNVSSSTGIEITCKV